VHVCVGEGKAPAVVRVYKYRYYILYCSLQIE
jgi:hypothetical protein